MPFSHVPKNPGDLIKSEDWNNALDAIVDLFNKFNNATGHTHSGSDESGPPIPEAGIANNAVTNGKIQDGAISNTKIQDGTITTAKVAPGSFSRDIGIALAPTLSNGQTIPPPTGFTAQECIFFVAVTSATTNVNIPFGGGNFTASYTVKVGPTGVVVIGANNMTVTVAGLALAKRGGWVN